MPGYHLIAVQIERDERETLRNLRDGLASDERLVGHVVDDDGPAPVLVAIVKRGVSRAGIISRHARF